MDQFSSGAYRFMLGFAKKVLIADSVAPLADSAFALENPTTADAWIGILAYTVQLYFDFSGYSDMAIGLGKMMGFKFIENFNNPYISRSITEFWQRWHISLSTWLRDYLYIPLGGNRKGKTRTYINLMLTMVLGGLWHGANWTFVLWGFWHGGIMAVERAIAGKNPRKGDQKSFYSLAALPMLALTFLFVIIGWVLFRAESVSDAFNLYQAMFSVTGLLSGEGFSDVLTWQIEGLSIVTLIIGLFLIFAVPILELRTGFSVKNSRHIAMQIFSLAIFILAVIKLTASSYSPFLYFQF